MEDRELTDQRGLKVGEGAGHLHLADAREEAGGDRGRLDAPGVLGRGAQGRHAGRDRALPRVGPERRGHPPTVRGVGISSALDDPVQGALRAPSGAEGVGLDRHVEAGVPLQDPVEDRGASGVIAGALDLEEGQQGLQPEGLRGAELDGVAGGDAGGVGVAPEALAARAQQEPAVGLVATHRSAGATHAARPVHLEVVRRRLRFADQREGLVDHGAALKQRLRAL